MGFPEVGGKVIFIYFGFENPIHTNTGSDIGLVWSFNTCKEWADDPGPKTVYEKLYGPGSWLQLMDEWKDIYADYNSEIRSFVK